MLSYTIGSIALLKFLQHSEICIYANNIAAVVEDPLMAKLTLVPRN